MLVYVKTWESKLMEIIVEVSDRIEDIKYKLKDKYNFEPSEIRLFYNMKQLDDSLTVEDYEIKEFDILQLFLRLRG